MKRILSVFLTLVLLMAGCQEEEGGPVQQLAGPELISCDPADGAQDL